MTIRCRPPRAITHDAVRPTLTSSARSCSPAIDVGTLTSEPPKPPSADQVRLDPSSCAASRSCNASPTPAASLANALRKAGSSSPGTPAESCRSHAHRSNSPWDFKTVSGAPSAPARELSCPSVWQRCYRDHESGTDEYLHPQRPLATVVTSSLPLGGSSRPRAEAGACRVR